MIDLVAESATAFTKETGFPVTNSNETRQGVDHYNGRFLLGTTKTEGNRATHEVSSRLLQVAAQGFEASCGVEVSRSRPGHHDGRINHFNGASGAIAGYSHFVRGELVHHGANNVITGKTAENVGHPFIHRGHGSAPAGVSKESGLGLELVALAPITATPSDLDCEGSDTLEQLPMDHHADQDGFTL